MALLNNKIHQRPAAPQQAADPWGGTPPRRAQFGRQQQFQPPPLPQPPPPVQPPGGLLNNQGANMTRTIPKGLLDIGEEREAQPAQRVTGGARILSNTTGRGTGSSGPRVQMGNGGPAPSIAPADNSITRRRQAALQSATGQPDQSAVDQNTFGTKNLSKDDAFAAITDLRNKGFTNANDLAAYLARDYGITDPRQRYALTQEWSNKYQPEVVAKNKSARDQFWVDANAKRAAAGMEPYWPDDVKRPAGSSAAPSPAKTQVPSVQPFTGTVRDLEAAVAASLAQGYSIADSKKGAFEKYGVTQDQWNAINWANVPDGSTGTR